ncbi:hypothetical protein BH09VER1_BH09VER1_26580 [soil metagenome]
MKLSEYKKVYHDYSCFERSPEQIKKAAGDILVKYLALHQEVAAMGNVEEKLAYVAAKEDGIRELLAAQKASASEDLVGAKIVARTLGISERTLRQYAEEGVVPSYQLGKHRRYRLREIFGVLEEARKSVTGTKNLREVRRRIIR